VFFLAFSRVHDTLHVWRGTNTYPLCKGSPVVKPETFTLMLPAS
jgi:hypothetical protein